MKLDPALCWGDIAFVLTDEGWLCLAVVIKLFTRQGMGLSTGERVTRVLMIKAHSLVQKTTCGVADLPFG